MIRLENVSKTYPMQDDQLIVLNDINLNIEDGEIFGIVGATGSGKSTLLRIMNGFIEVDNGEVYLQGEKLTHESKHELVKQTSMVFQNFNLLNNLTVIDNVLLPMKLRKGDKAASTKKAHELLEFVGLADFANMSISTLSGGGKQRVAIARALMTDPKVIFTDEPTSALDEKMRYEVLSLLKRAHKKFDTTIVVVSHDTQVIQALCDRVAVLEDGKIVDILELEPTELKPVTYQEAFNVK